MPLKLIFGQFEYSLDGSRLRIGRADHLDITISGDPLVSSQHCVIQGGKLTDAQSTNGTMINRSKIPYQTPIQLKHGDVVTVGETNLFVEEGIPYEDANGQPIAHPPSSSSSSSMIQVAPHGGSSSSRHGSRNLSSAVTYAYNDPHPSDALGGGEDRSAFTNTYSYGNGTGDDLSSTIHSTSEWNSTISSAMTKEKSGDASSDDSGDESVTVDSKDGDIHISTGDGLNYSYGSSSSSSSLRPPSQSPQSAGGPRLSSPSTIRTGGALNGGSGPIPSTSTYHPASATEEEIWNLKQALTKSELKCMNLEKKLNHTQRKSNLLAAKQRISKFESQIQNLEYQMFYGDTMKDRELDTLKQAMELQQNGTAAIEFAEKQQLLDQIAALVHDIDAIKEAWKQNNPEKAFSSLSYVSASNSSAASSSSAAATTYLAPPHGKFKPTTMKKGMSAALTAEAATNSNGSSGTASGVTPSTPSSLTSELTPNSLLRSSPSFSPHPTHTTTFSPPGISPTSRTTSGKSISPGNTLPPSLSALAGFAASWPQQMDLLLASLEQVKQGVTTLQQQHQQLTPSPTGLVALSPSPTPAATTASSTTTTSSPSTATNAALTAAIQETIVTALTEQLTSQHSQQLQLFRDQFQTLESLLTKQTTSLTTALTNSVAALPVPTSPSSSTTALLSPITVSLTSLSSTQNAIQTALAALLEQQHQFQQEWKKNQAATTNNPSIDTSAISLQLESLKKDELIRCETRIHELETALKEERQVTTTLSKAVATAKETHTHSTSAPTASHDPTAAASIRQSLDTLQQRLSQYCAVGGAILVVGIGLLMFK